MNAIVNHDRLYGAGVGGKAGGSGPTEEKNTLLSNATAQLIDFISQGPIAGLVNGEKSIFFDGVPLENQDGSKNFSGISYQYRIGEETQSPVSIIDDTENEQGVNIEVTTANGPVTQTLLEENVDGFRVRVRIPALAKVKDDGDIVAHTVSYSILWAPYGSGTFQHIPGSPFTLTGKNSSPYYIDHAFDPPTPGPWSIRMVRETPDETTVKNSSETWFDAIVGVLHQKMIYPWSAYFAWKVDAEQFGSSIPTRTYHVRGRIIRVPTNYDPETRVYTGIWDGTFKLAWTNNPAWVLFDLLTNTRYGARISDEKIDIAALYRIAKYCDGMVPDGYGGTRPRYTINVTLNSQQQAYTLINSILSNFRSMIFWAGGQFSFSQDAPTDEVVALVTPANTENGFFSYTSSTDKSRANIAYVQYNNPKNQDRPDFEVVTLNADVVKRGPRIVRLTAFGCRDQSQAQTHGDWLLYTLHHDTEKVSYVAGLDHEQVRPGDIIAIADPLKSGTRMAAGRLVSVAAGSATIDRTVDLPSGYTYQIAMTTKDGNIVYRDLQTFTSSQTTLAFTANVTAADFQPNSVWMIFRKDVGMRKYRVTNVGEKRGKRLVSALLYNPSKYDYVERDRPLTEPPVDPFVGGDIQPPRYFTPTPIRINRPGATNRVDCLFSWTYPANDPRVTAFQLQFADDSDVPVWRTIYRGRDLSYVLENINGAGTLKAARIRAIGPTDRDVSPWVQINNIELLTRATPPASPASLNLVALTYGNGIRVSWEVTEPDDFWYVEVWRSATNNINTATLVGTSTERYYVDNELPEGTAYYYWVRTRVRTDNASVQYSVFLGPQTVAALPPPNTDILDDSITQSKIADAAISASKIMDEAVTNLKLADQAVSTAKLQVAAVTADVLANQAVVSTKLADAAVTAQKLAAQVVDATKFASGIKPVEVASALPTTDNVEGRMVYLTTDDKLYRYTGSGWVASVASSDITGTLVSTQIADAAITNSKLAALAIDAEKLATNAVTTTKIADDAISTLKLQANAITADKIAANTINATHISAGAITASKLTIVNFENIVPSFEGGDLSGWAHYGLQGFYLQGEGDLMSGTWIAQSNSRDQLVSSKNIPVSPGEGYYVSAWVYNSDASRANLMFFAKNSSGSVITYPVVSYTDVKGAWTKLEGIYTVPPGVSFLTMLLQTERVPGEGSSTYWGKPVMLRASGAELIVDGAITADKLAVNSVTAGKIAAGAVAADQIAANSVIASKIAAGAITTDKLAVGQGANFIKNSDFSAGITGWGVEYANADLSNWTISLRNDAFAPVPGALEIRQGNGTQGIEIGVTYKKDGSNFDFVSVEAGKWYELSTYYFGHRCNGIQPYVAFMDAAGTVLAVSSPGVWPANQNFYPGRQLSNYQRNWFKTQAPAGVAYAYVFFRHKGTINGENDSYLWIHKPFFGEATANQSEPTPWSAAGVTLIQNGNIVAGAVTADSLAVNSVTADKIAAGSVVADKLAASAVTADKIAAASISGDKIAANTIGANNIAANSITAKHLVLTDFTNLVPDNHVQAFGSSWIGNNWVEWSDPGLYDVGLGVAHLCYPYQSGTAGYGDEMSSEMFTVEASTGYRIYAAAYSHNPYGVWLRLHWFDTNKNLLTWSDFLNTSSGTAAGLQKATQNVTSPGAAKYARVHAYVQRSVTSGTVWVGGFSVQKRNAAELIVEGTITADKLAVNSVTADKLAANSVTAAAIAANSITADKLNVTSLSAITANFGDVEFSGVAKSSGGGKLELDFTNGTISVYD